MCHGAGWILDGNPFAEPQHLEFIECVLHDCPFSGRPISALSLKGPSFATVAHHPAEGWVMSLTTKTVTT
jgi:hypothetical protein